jgi:hypothetical protein
MTASPLKKVAYLNVHDRQAVKNSLDELSRILGIEVDAAASTASLLKRHEELALALLRELGD